MFKPHSMKSDKQNVVTAVCDKCGLEHDVLVKYEGREPNTGQAMQKLVHNKWALVKGELLCNECNIKRKENNVVEIRQPSREVKREIVLLLNEVYDTNAGRYRGTDSDLTVADTIGNGCMFGWVAQIREEMFGPNGGNDEMIALKEEISAAIKKAQLDAEEDAKKWSAIIQNLNQLRDRIDNVAKSLGPKAVKAS